MWFTLLNSHCLRSLIKLMRFLLSQKCDTLLIPVIIDETTVQMDAILICNFTHICSSLICSTVRFMTLNNNHLQIRGIRKTDEGVYTCEGRIKARGEVDFRSIKVVVNGESYLPYHTCSALDLGISKDLTRIRSHFDSRAFTLAMTIGFKWQIIQMLYIVFIL